MMEPSGELVELDFYFDNLKSVDALQYVVECCCQRGGRFAGEALVSQSAGIRDEPFSDLYLAGVNVAHLDYAELMERFRSPDVRVVKVPIWSALGLIEDIPEVVTFCGLTDEAAKTESHPVSIISRGDVFSTSDDDKQIEIAGKTCYARFIELCDNLAPDYAAILNEESLLCKSDLRSGNVDRQFRNFYVSSASYRDDVMSRLAHLFRDAYVEHRNTGVYISTHRFYNPSGTELESHQARQLSRQAAYLLSGVSSTQ